MGDNGWESMTPSKLTMTSATWAFHVSLLHTTTKECTCSNDTWAFHVSLLHVSTKECTCSCVEEGDKLCHAQHVSVNRHTNIFNPTIHSFITLIVNTFYIDGYNHLKCVISSMWASKALDYTPPTVAMTT